MALSPLEEEFERTRNRGGPNPNAFAGDPFGRDRALGGPNPDAFAGDPFGRGESVNQQPEPPKPSEDDLSPLEKRFEEERRRQQALQDQLYADYLARQALERQQQETLGETPSDAFDEEDAEDEEEELDDDELSPLERDFELERLRQQALKDRLYADSLLGDSLQGDGEDDEASEELPPEDPVAEEDPPEEDDVYGAGKRTEFDETDEKVPENERLTPEIIEKLYYELEGSDPLSLSFDEYRIVYGDLRPEFAGGPRVGGGGDTGPGGRRAPEEEGNEPEARVLTGVQYIPGLQTIGEQTYFYDVRNDQWYEINEQGQSRPLSVAPEGAKLLTDPDEPEGRYDTGRPVYDDERGLWIGQDENGRIVYLDEEGNPVSDVDSELGVYHVGEDFIYFNAERGLWLRVDPDGNEVLVPGFEPPARTELPDDSTPNGREQLANLFLSLPDNVYYDPEIGHFVRIEDSGRRVVVTDLSAFELEPLDPIHVGDPAAPEQGAFPYYYNEAADAWIGLDEEGRRHLLDGPPEGYYYNEVTKIIYYFDETTEQWYGKHPTEGIPIPVDESGFPVGPDGEHIDWQEEDWFLRAFQPELFEQDPGSAYYYDEESEQWIGLDRRGEKLVLDEPPEGYYYNTITGIAFYYDETTDQWFGIHPDRPGYPIPTDDSGFPLGPDGEYIDWQNPNWFETAFTPPPTLAENSPYYFDETTQTWYGRDQHGRPLALEEPPEGYYYNTITSITFYFDEKTDQWFGLHPDTGGRPILVDDTGFPLGPDGEHIDWQEEGWWEKAWLQPERDPPAEGDETGLEEEGDEVVEDAEDGDAEDDDPPKIFLPTGEPHSQYDPNFDLPQTGDALFLAEIAASALRSNTEGEISLSVEVQPDYEGDDIGYLVGANTVAANADDYYFPALQIAVLEAEEARTSLSTARWLRVGYGLLLPPDAEGGDDWVTAVRIHFSVFFNEETGEWEAEQPDDLETPIDISAETREERNEQIRDVATFALDLLRQRCPVQSGRMRDSLRESIRSHERGAEQGHVPDIETYAIGARVYYAVWVASYRQVVNEVISAAQLKGQEYDPPVLVRSTTVELDADPEGITRFGPGVLVTTEESREGVGDRQHGGAPYPDAVDSNPEDGLWKDFRF